MCECKLIYFCAMLVSIVTCFNIDQQNYAVYEPVDNNRSMFGFTVAVHKDRGHRGWILVGAPEGQSIFQDANVVRRGGTVYKCRSEGDDVCEQIPFDRTNNVGFGDIPIDEKSGQWFGATLSSSGRMDGPIVACAPRYIWFTKDLNRRDPVGTCFVSSGAFDNFEEYSPCRTMNWGYHRQGSCQAGFSAAINREGDRLYVGAPGSYYWQGQMYSIDAHAHFNYTPGIFGNLGYGAKGSVHQQSLETRPAVFSTREGKAPDDDSYIGYSTVVGHFQQGQEYEGIAVGMPRGNKLRGKVLLFTWDLVNYKNITISKQIGSYFGYALAAADVNGDKKLDLIVGAPMHTEPNTEGKYDVGRVYVFYQSSNFLESFNKSHFLDGINSKGRFGHALASLGDLNQDGFDDFAVGAPYDGPNGRGAVYIYYGSKEGIRQKFGQVIYAEAISGGRQYLTTFGFSLTGGLDLDDNEYPDMAVGAYLSNSAFFFRSRPVVFIDSYVQFQSINKKIDLKQKNCHLPNGQEGTCTSIDFCIKYYGKGIPDHIYLNVQYILDTLVSAPRMGFQSYGTNTFNNTISLAINAKEHCKREEVFMKNDFKDKLTPLEAEVKFFMIESTTANNFRDPQSILRPILDLNNPPSRKDSITIQKNCGPDDICIPNLHVNVTSNVDKYLLGSNTTIEFDVIVSNFGEDAFETTFEITYPEGVFYKGWSKKIGWLCNDVGNRTVLCEIGNPLPSKKIANFKVLFQPYHQEGLPSSYIFNCLVNSTNPEPKETWDDNKKNIVIDIWIDATLDVKGQSYPTLQPLSYYNESLSETMKEVRKETEIGPEVVHIYYVTNKGPSPIQEAEVFILWPLTSLGNEDLLYLMDQPHTQGNVKCDHVPLVNYRKVKQDMQSSSLWERYHIDISAFVVGNSAQKITGEKPPENTIEIGPGITSGIGVVNKGTNLDVNQTTGDASSIWEQRHNETDTSTTDFRTWGTLNPNGEYELTVSKAFTRYINGQPVKTWENTTTIRDRQGHVLRTLYFNDYTNDQYGNNMDSLSYKFDLKQGEFEHRQANYHITYDENGNAHTTWQNKTIITDSNGNILRSYYWDENTGIVTLINESGNIYNIQEEMRRKEELEQKRLDDLRRQEQLRKDQMRIDQIRQQLKQEQERRLEDERKRLAETNRQIAEQKRLEDERRRIDELRRRDELRREEERRRLEEARINKENEEKRREEIRIQNEARRREEEIRLEEERRREEARYNANRFPSHQNRYDEERRKEEENRRAEEKRREEERRRIEQIKVTEERRRQEQARLEQWRKQQEQIRARQEDERRRMIQNGWTEEQIRRYFEEVRRREHAENSGGFTSGSYDQYGNRRVVTGYFDSKGNYHDSNNPNEIIFNKTFVVESSTSYPIEFTAGDSRTFSSNFDDLGSGFTVQTLNLGGNGDSNNKNSAESRVSSNSRTSNYASSSNYGGSSRATSSGGYGQRNSDSGSGTYRREWSSEGSSFTSGKLPTTYFHNSIESDVANDEPIRHSKSRDKRQALDDPYEYIKALVKCKSTECIYIRCVVGALDKNKDVYIALRSRLNVRALKDIPAKDQSIKLSSMMVGSITELPFLKRIDKNKQVMIQHEIFTEIPAKEVELIPEVAPLWIYIVSAVAGIVMLLLLIWLLSKCGFFKRNRPAPGPERQPLNRNGYHSGDEAL
ncbi:integrin alpha-PS2 isoform X1 [Diorhabda carinulata]|uniref:integrin alpha-PS2 isoform X1 n=1 Tax=Diorhabda carinulata TaxID=1163345 RepID=UPI0025A08ECB|nr:integrin alpha-PS2 isoform X1 [Diorhabda carinulata]